MLRGRDPRAIVMPDGALTIETEVDIPVASSLKRVGLNLAVLPNEALYLLQDSVIMELQAYEQHVLQVINEQKVNNAQLTV